MVYVYGTVPGYSPIEVDCSFIPGNRRASSRQNLSSGFPKKVRFQPACSATGTSYKIEIPLVASFDMVLSKTLITKALIRLLTPEDRFSRVAAQNIID